jgi:hypothetical protein
LYEQRVLEIEKRRELSGKRLRQLWEQEAFEKQAKQIQVRELPAAGPCFAASSHRWWKNCKPQNE